MARLNNAENRGTASEKIGAIAQTILSEGNIDSYNKYREIKDKIDNLNKQISQETDPNKILELTEQRNKLQQENGVRTSVEERFEIQKARYMNGHATDFLNKFSITENIFRNNAVYQQLQQYNTFSGVYNGFDGYQTSIVMRIWILRCLQKV